MITNNTAEPRGIFAEAYDKLFGVFAGLLPAGDDVVRHIVNMFHEKEYDRDEYVLNKGDRIRYVGFVVSGVLRIFTTSADGSESNIIFLDEGCVTCGSFLPVEASEVNIQCLTPVTMLRADYMLLLEYLDTKKLLLPYLSKILARSHSGIQFKLTQYIRLNAQGRYNAFLNDHPNLINRVPHYHVANYLGITGTQLSRIRRKLAEKSQ